MFSSSRTATVVSAIPRVSRGLVKFVNVISLVDKIEYDNLGSLIAYKGKNGPKIMLAGHMDE
ncbi:MAG: peptidase M28, partial [Pigeon pea little leaf phytoplasma]|nr:peptidase M28 [Pigeon pea little leaf phytoplasma]